jgi:hypothetical protein
MVFLVSFNLFFIKKNLKIVFNKNFLFNHFDILILKINLKNKKILF